MTQHSEPQQIVVSDFSDFLEKVGDAVRSLPLTRAYWRGQLSREALVPYAFRCEGDKPVKSKRETDQVLDFQHIAPARDRGCPSKEERLEWLALMQHSGLPTRLLDWSESPLVAAFFAAERGGEDSAVWMLDPEMLNSKISSDYRVYPIENKYVKTTAEAAFNAQDELSGAVLALVPCHFYPQQIGQQSCFTIHGNDDPLEKHSAAGEFLKKFIVPAEITENVRERLTELSVKRHFLFPDLPTLAEEIRERHNKAGKRTK